MTDVARHLLPRRRPDRLRRRRATCTCRRATTRTRSSRRATRRSTTGRTATRRSTPGARRATRTTCAASSCASTSATTAATTVPQGNLFRQGQAQTRPEIYVMGLRNPFRFAVNRTNGDVYLGDYSPDAQTADPARGPEGIGRWMIVRRRGQLRLAVLRHAGQAVRRLRLHAGRASSPARSSTATRRPTTRATTPACASCRRSPGRRSGTRTPRARTCSRSCSRTRRTGNGIGPMGGPAMQFDAQHRVGVPLAARVRGASALLRVDARLREGLRAQPAQRQPARRHPRTCSAASRPSRRTPTSCSTTRWTWSSGRTTRSTRSSTARATSPSCPAAQLARIDYVRNGQYTPVVRASATPSSGTTAPLTVQFSSAGTDGRQRRPPRLRVGLRLQRHGRLHAWRTRRTPTPRAASTRPRSA